MGFPEFTTPAGLSALENHLVHVSYIEGSVSLLSSLFLKHSTWVEGITRQDDNVALVRVSE